jgi:rubrerythrin
LKKPLLPNAGWLRAKGVFAFFREGDHPAFQAVAAAAKAHEARSRALDEAVESGQEGERSRWKWRGYTLERTTPPVKCPGCKHTEAFSEVVEEVI